MSTIPLLDEIENGKVRIIAKNGEIIMPIIQQLGCLSYNAFTRSACGRLSKSNFLIML